MSFTLSLSVLVISLFLVSLFSYTELGCNFAELRENAFNQELLQRNRNDVM